MSRGSLLSIIIIMILQDYKFQVRYGYGIEIKVACDIIVHYLTDRSCGDLCRLLFKIPYFTLDIVNIDNPPS